MTDQKKKNLTVYYGVIQFTFWFGYAATGAFANPFLQSVGMSTSLIGIVIAVSSLAAAFLQPVLGSLIDKSRKLTNRRLMLILGIVVIAIGLVLGLCNIESKSAIAVILCVAIILIQIGQPFINALGMECVNSGHKMLMGPARACGSFGYAISAFLLGKLSEKVGHFTIPLTFAIAYGALMIALVILPAVADSVQQKEKAKGTNPIAFLKKYPVFSLFLVGLICVYFGHTLVNTYALQILQSKGGNSESVGIATFLAAIFEMIPMLIFPFIRKRFAIRKLIPFSAIFFALKTLGSLLVPTVTGYYFVMALQFPAWGILTISLIYYVDSIIARDDASQGQAYASMTLSVASVLSAFICGTMIDNCGITATLLLGTGVGLVGAVILFITTKK